jgi:hypothetical protein
MHAYNGMLVGMFDNPTSTLFLSILLYLCCACLAAPFFPQVLIDFLSSKEDKGKQFLYLQKWYRTWEAGRSIECTVSVIYLRQV